MRSHHRDAIDFVRDTYGVPARVEHCGQKHPRLIFAYKGVEHKIPLAGSPSDSYRGRQQMQAQIKGVLGDPPPPPPAREPRRLEAMMPGSRPEPAPERTAPDGVFMGCMAHYTEGSLRFFPPKEVAAHFGGSAVLVTRPGRVDWELRRMKGQTPQVRPDGSKFRLEAGYAGEALPLFGGRSPAEYLIVDDAVLVRLLVDQLVPVKPMKAREKRPAAPPNDTAPRGVPAMQQDTYGPEQPTTGIPVQPKITVPDADEWVPPSMLDTLRAVQYYERASWRMSHKAASGRAFWKPPAAIEIEED